MMDAKVPIFDPAVWERFRESKEFDKKVAKFREDLLALKKNNPEVFARVNESKARSQSISFVSMDLNAIDEIVYESVDERNFVVEEVHQFQASVDSVKVMQSEYCVMDSDELADLWCEAKDFNVVQEIHCIAEVSVTQNMCEQGNFIEITTNVLNADSNVGGTNQEIIPDVLNDNASVCGIIQEIVNEIQTRRNNRSTKCNEICEHIWERQYSELQWRFGKTPKLARVKMR